MRSELDLIYRAEICRYFHLSLAEVDALSQIERDVLMRWREMCNSG